MNNKYSVYILGLFLTSNVFAADSAQLETRIAQLEAQITRLEALVLQSNQPPAPVTVQTTAAKSNNPLYGSLRIAVRGSKQGDDKTTEVSSAGTSRFGFKNSHAISDDLTAIYHLEWGLGSTGSNFNLNNSGTRIAYAGLQGAFGDIRLGRDWSGSYNFVGEKVDIFSLTPASTYDDFAYGDNGGHARIGSALHYRTKLDKLKLQLDARVGGDNNPSGVSQWVVAGEYPLPQNVNIGAYYSSIKGSGTITAKNQTGLSLSLKPSSNLSIAGAYFNQNYTDAGDNQDFNAFDLAAILNTNILGSGGSFRAVYGNLDYDDPAKNDYNQWQIGLRKQYDKYRLLAWYNVTNTDTEEDEDGFTIGARYDF